MAEPTPGQVITPGNNPPEPPENPAPPIQEVSVNLSQNTPVVPPAVAQPQQEVPLATPQVIPQAQQPDPFQAPMQVAQPIQTSQAPAETPSGGFAPQFQIEDPNDTNVDDPQLPLETISWTASEYIAHQKSLSWYAALVVLAVAFSGLIYFITGGDIMSSAVILLVAIVFGIYAGKNPKEQRYAISVNGVSVGAKTYSFNQLKSFSITDEGAFSSITFMPMKRFMPVISIYYDPQDEEKIADTISNYLPLENHPRDVVDGLMRKIRF